MGISGRSGRADHQGYAQTASLPRPLLPGPPCSYCRRRPRLWHRLAERRITSVHQGLIPTLDPPPLPGRASGGSIAPPSRPVTRCCPGQCDVLRADADDAGVRRAWLSDHVRLLRLRPGKDRQPKGRRLDPLRRSRPHVQRPRSLLKRLDRVCCGRIGLRLIRHRPAEFDGSSAGSGKHGDRPDLLQSHVEHHRLRLLLCGYEQQRAAGWHRRRLDIEHDAAFPTQATRSTCRRSAHVEIANSIFAGSFSSAYRGCATCSEHNNDWYGGTSNLPSSAGDQRVAPGLSAAPALAPSATSAVVDAGSTSISDVAYSASCDGAILHYCLLRPDQGAVENV